MCPFYGASYEVVADVNVIGGDYSDISTYNDEQEQSISFFNDLPTSIKRGIVSISVAMQNPGALIISDSIVVKGLPLNNPANQFEFTHKPGDSSIISLDAIIVNDVSAMESVLNDAISYMQDRLDTHGHVRDHELLVQLNNAVRNSGILFLRRDFIKE
jgi:hypothetical protein